MRRFAALGAGILLLGGCALPVPVQIASWALDGFSYLLTEKFVTDHGISVLAQKDCALLRGLLDPGEFCRDFDDTATALADGGDYSVLFSSGETAATADGDIAGDIAVIIGNANYTEGKDIPNVTPAYADAEGMKRYVRQALGVAEDNIIFIKDATQKDMVSTFGSGTNHKGKLFGYLVPGKSRVFVYYAGHGAPGEGDSNYLVPTDAEASLIDLNGYPIKTLYKNLSKLPAKSVTLVLEACFSGASQGGSLVTRSSGITVVPKASTVPSNITVISAGAADQIASWEEDKSHSLFTKYFLKGMSGEADTNKDSKVSWVELKDYLAKTVPRCALRYYGREQTVQIVSGG